MTAIAWVAVGASAFASIPAGLRWLRVSQREHYLAGQASRFALRWWRASAVNLLLVLVALLAAGVSFAAPAAALLTAVVAALGPIGLSLRGRTSPLAWTRRLRTLAIVAGLLELLVLAIGVLLGVGAGLAALSLLLLPVLVDLAAWILAPVERRLGARFVAQAALRLRSISPEVVGITGSYGKTSTKNHLVTLLGSERSVVPSPRSFNNRAGLARAINEQLAPGTDVFIAEMGTYGPGEIAAMVAWCPPQVAVITAIGPVHLERFGSLDVTLAAKSEITTGARAVVLNIDDDRLRQLAERLGTETRILRASSHDRAADVAVLSGPAGWEIFVAGELLAELPAPAGVQAGNAACALAAAIALGLEPKSAAGRMASLRAVENRQSVLVAPSGLRVIDDTFNANPAGADAALDLLAAQPVSGRRVLVTPGMIELGPRQAADNEALARRAASIAQIVVVVGQSKARALLAGLEDSSVELLRVRTRDEAVDWVRATLGPDDVVLYENDLPDHYP